MRNFLITFFLSLLVFGLIAFLLVQFTTSAFELNQNEAGTDTTPAETKGPSGPSGTETDSQDLPLVDIPGESFTVLLVGTDYQPDVYQDYTVAPGTYDENGFPAEPRLVEADTIILLRINKETGECIYCAIPATARITVEGLTYQLKELYGLKGINALCTKVMAMTSLPIDFYAVITMSSMRSLIDDLGGITYYVAADMHYEDPEIGLSINLRRGSQKLNGENAVKMLRYAGYADGDVSRRQCGVNFLKELFKKILSKTDIGGAAVAYTKYASYVETNFTISDLGKFAELIFAYPRMTVVDYTYPGSVIGNGDSAYFSANIARAIDYFSRYKYQG